jgi:hypothetical protein
MQVTAISRAAIYATRARRAHPASATIRSNAKGPRSYRAPHASKRNHRAGVLDWPPST